MRQKFSVPRLNLFLILLALLSGAACDDSVSPADLFSPGVPASGRFVDFYTRLGGLEVLGPVISPEFSYGPIYYQYTRAALMAHDPGLPGQKQFYLAATGLDLGVRHSAIQPPDDPGLRYVGGQIIPAGFLPLYERLGARLVGQPLTGARYNPELQRYEQYFANLGFYRMEDDPPDTVRLLAYGSWRCGADCQNANPGGGQVLPPPAVGEKFAGAVERLGPDLTGFPLGEPYLTPDGYHEQVFENVVLAMKPNKPRQVFLRPLAASLGIDPEPLEAAGDQPGMTFVGVQGGGYFVPAIFYDYLARHGGLDASGLPIGAYRRLREGVYRQCFANLCLEEHRDLEEPLRVRPSPLGVSYAGLPLRAMETDSQAQVIAQDVQGVIDPTQPAPDAGSPPERAAAHVTLQTWVRHPVVSPGGTQEITVLLLEGKSPVAGVEPDLTILQADGSRQILYMLPTGADGRTSQVLDGVDAPSGTVAAYEVCVYYPQGEKVCTEGEFLVWQEP